MMNGFAIPPAPPPLADDAHEAWMATRRDRIATWLKLGQVLLQDARYMNKRARWAIYANAFFSAYNLAATVSSAHAAGWLLFTLSCFVANTACLLWICRELQRYGWTAADIAELEAANAEVYRYMLAHDIEPLPAPEVVA